MVTRAIERAQNTVEGRNAEIRKDVLKYDEVMNEQRKVIYARRHQVIDGEDIHDATIELLEERLTDVVDQHIGAGFAEEWDLNALVLDLQTYYPTTLNVETLKGYDDVDEVAGPSSTKQWRSTKKKSADYQGGVYIAARDRT